MRAPAGIKMMITQEVYQQLHRLSAIEKLQLAELLLADLDSPDPQLDAVWRDEAERRWQAYRAGQAKTVSYVEAMRKYK